MPAPYLSEIKFLGSPNDDFIEVAVDAGTDVSNIQVVVYNPNGTVRSTNTLGPLVNTIAGRDVYVIDTATSATFSGLHKNGAVALVVDGTVTSFLSFNSTVTATEGPASGLTSTALGTTGNGESLETSDDGASYQVQPVPTPGNVPCFLTGTLIMTSRGARPVEDLQAGDKVLTADGGMQPILWAGERRLSGQEHSDPAKLPVRIPAGALAPGVPERDLYVSPNHRMVLEHPLAGLFFHAGQVLAPAKALVGTRGIGTAPVQFPVRYHHLLLASHQVIFANGAATESLHLTQLSIEGFREDQQAQIQTAAGWPQSRGPTARMVLKPSEARLLMAASGEDDLVSPPALQGTQRFG